MQPRTGPPTGRSETRSICGGNRSPSGRNCRHCRWQFAASAACQLTWKRPTWRRGNAAESDSDDRGLRRLGGGGQCMTSSFILCTATLLMAPSPKDVPEGAPLTEEQLLALLKDK